MLTIQPPLPDITYRTEKRATDHAPSVRCDVGDPEQGFDTRVPPRHRRSPVRRSGGRQHRPTARQQVRFGEVRGPEAPARSHRPGVRRLQFLPSGESPSPARVVAVVSSGLSWMLDGSLAVDVCR